MLSLDRLTRFSCRVQYNHSSTSHFRSGGRIRYLLTPQDGFGVLECIKQLKNNNIPYLTTGNVTNILIKDEGFKGAFISTKELTGIKPLDDGYYVQSGVGMHSLALRAKTDELSGLEELSDIPGTVGGLIAMNASAFDKSIKDVLEYVDVVIDGDVERLKVQDLDMGYRHSLVLDKNFTILGAKILLRKENLLYINAKMKKYADLRAKKQPRGVSLGSVFKKVGNISAGYYIEKAGLKGEKVGGAMISTKHANFIINVNNAKSRDFITLANMAKSRVDKAFNISLKYEILII